MLSSIAEKHVVPLMVLSQHYHTMKGKTALFGHNHVFSAVTVLGLDVSILEAGLSNTPNSSTSPLNPDLKSHSQSIDIQDSTIELPIFAERLDLTRKTLQRWTIETLPSCTTAQDLAIMCDRGHPAGRCLDVSHQWPSY